MGEHLQKNNYFKIHKSRKIVVTLLVMFILITFSGIMASRISAMEEQECWNTLEQTAQHTTAELRNMVNGDQELLESIATIIEGMESMDSPKVQKIIDEFQPNTMISHIALLLPGNQVMLPNEPMRETNGILSFEEEAALGKHISDRSVDIRDESRFILRNFVPILNDGETVALLYGVVDLQTLPELLDRSSYDGKVQITIMDAESGDYIVDTWHDTLGNVDDYGNREHVSGQSPDELRQMALEGASGYTVFESKSFGEKLYFYSSPVGINQWTVGIHVTESLVFARMIRVNRMLFGFISAEVVLLACYFIWILISTRKELVEKQRLADTDLLTGLLNRNCYEKNIAGVPSDCRENLTCIYVDANGLHELNNTKGHAAGDKMLQEVARTIQKRFGEKNTYRIGGDEFVAFAMDEAAEVIQKKLADINTNLSELDYHVSVGICREDVPVEMDRLIKQAEVHMYEEKRRYYQQAGKDRRNRK
ncbi:MAG: sensor domain-containing diguanylate cyclase [Lachnospiraceae bacterium]|nr:sensor domain-containing diguanylate cyclase [Lachnospiraceae bacterium]